MYKILTGAVIAAGIATAVAPVATADEPFVMCPSGRSGVATSVTSCAFADNVRYAYMHQSGQVVVAYSPVTDQYYAMQCGEGFISTFFDGTSVRSTRCVGGNNAVVVVW